MKSLTRFKPSKPASKSELVGTPTTDEVSSLYGDIAILTDPQGARAEAIRALRTHIVAQHINEGRRALAICAASLGVGCTFVAVNLAVALSQVGVKVLLIDGDMRQPSVDRYFIPGHSMGLRQALSASDVPFGETIDLEILPNLSVMHAGGAATNPQELLGSLRFQELIEVCLRDFDVTIVDTPPANASADARRISNVVGYGLVVAQQDKSLVEDIKTLVGELQGDGAVLVGTVLNEA